MDTTVSIDLTQVASEFSLPLERIERTIELLDEGNTVPFITRFRKDQTRGLDEQQIRSIQQRIAKLRMLAERKSTILRSIDSQGKLTQEFAENIRKASSTKVLEDLYLPFKPKKQTLATLARRRGLEPLANEIHEGTTLAENLAARAAEFVRVDRQVSSVDEVMQGVGHLLAERFGERADLRDRLRKIIWSTGKLVSADITKTSNNNTSSKSESSGSATSSNKLADSAAQSTTEGNARHDSVSESAESPQPHQIDSSSAENSVTVPDGQVEETLASDVAVASSDVGSFANGNESQPASTGDSEPSAKGLEDANEKPIAAKQTATKNKKKKRKEDAAFEDYYNFQEPVSRVPPHRILAINRGERAKMLRPRIEVDEAAVKREAEELLIPPDHPHADFLRDCVQDALARLVMPTLEREIRRELTEMAEGHAVQVFARNLRKLLLQPPVRRHRVLAIDPGYRSGCKMCAVDEFGNLVADGVIHVVGNEERRKKGREDLVKMIREANVSVVAIGNGTACRQTEQLIADVISDELKDLDVSYVIVNEAGASVYSTSATGREELPEQDAAIRSAISIGRRLLDPLSELVKINPANLGVGLYQHDVKAKHLQESLDAVVESCVNFVGVDVNTASPSLLRYVSGLNQLTARRMY
ncbi:MAG: helix-hairpin-helix domain-containing protein, partial [Planctomycetes bacterium]|nr:helix-hairpin-helix domain-containing protein [Planctomycetota bacterium]